MLTLGVILYSVVRLFHPVIDGVRKKKGPPINHTIKKESPKVVDAVDIEDIDKEKISYCRCWKSSKVGIHRTCDYHVISIIDGYYCENLFE